MPTAPATELEAGEGERDSKKQRQRGRDRQRERGRDRQREGLIEKDLDRKR